MSLSEQQKEIVNASLLGLGPVVVKAGPGSGKTHTVVSVIQSHLSTGVAPEDVIAITFTRRAARELKERLGRSGRKVRASTIDSLCLDIIQGTFPGTKPLSPFCAWIVFQICCDSYGVKPTPAKMEMMNRMRESPYTGCEREDGWQELEQVRDLYDQILSSSKYADYLWIMLQAVWVLMSNKWHGRCKLLILDEAQDTSLVQWELINKLAAKTHAQLVVVGDMNQNIYSWRNAAPEKFYELSNSLNAIAKPLKQSYRCSPKIVHASNALISLNPDAEADVEAMRTGVFDPVQVSTDVPELVASQILQGFYAPHDIAILCRTNRTVDQVARGLAEMGIKANAVHSQESSVGFLAAAGLFGVDQDNTVHQILFKTTAASVGFDIYGEDPQEIVASLIQNQNGMPIFRFVCECQNKNILFAEAIKELKDVPEFRAHTERLIERFGGFSVEDAFQQILAPSEVEESEGAVTVSTIHQAKGLEWPVVIITDLKEGTFPSNRSRKSEAGIIEERRLMYVAMTRAKDLLVLCKDSKFPSQFVFTEEFYNAQEVSGLGQTKIREAGW